MDFPDDILTFNNKQRNAVFNLGILSDKIFSLCCPVCVISVATSERICVCISSEKVLVTKPDFYNPDSRFNLKSTVLELLGLNILPIVNTNDTVVPPDHFGARYNESGEVMNIKDNDSLAAHLAAEVQADLLILMSDVDGIYTLPPGQDGARLLHSYCPSLDGNILYGDKSGVGLGGMESKVRAASWALERGVAVVICNGTAQSAIGRIIQGRRIGTFFTDHKSLTISVETQAANGSNIFSSCLAKNFY